MALVGLNEAAATGILGNPLGAATPSGMGQLLQILQLVKDIANSPLAATVAARFQGQGQGSTLQQTPIMNVPPPAEPPAQLPAPAPAPAPAAPVLDEKKFIEMLMNPQGREMMDKGLQEIINAIGDVPLSQVQSLLRSGKPLEQKVTNGK